MSQGEFSFTLRQDEDRNGDMYLFGSLKMFNSVIFIRPRQPDASGVVKWDAVIKPYVPKVKGVEGGDVWED